MAATAAAASISLVGALPKSCSLTPSSSSNPAILYWIFRWRALYPSIQLRACSFPYSLFANFEWKILSFPLSFSYAQDKSESVDYGSLPIDRRELILSSIGLLATAVCATGSNGAALASEFVDMPALRGKDYGKSKMRFPDYTETNSVCQSMQDLRVGSGPSPKTGDTVVVDWDGYTIGYYGRIFEARNKSKGGSFEGDDKDFYKFRLGSQEVIPAFEEALTGMAVGGIRRIIVPPELGYPDNDFNKKGPRPLTFSGQRALAFVLRNQESLRRLYLTMTFPLTPTTMAFQSISGNGEISSNSKFLSKWLQIAFICKYANGSPKHPCLPPPNDMYENGPAALSSSLTGENLSGSFFCSSTTDDMYLPLQRRYAPVQVDVIELVCWPANKAAMSKPVTSDSVVWRPSLYLESMKHCNISFSALPVLLREEIIFVKISASFLRARSRRRCAGIGRYGKSTLMGCIPLSRSDSGALKKWAETSGPIKKVMFLFTRFRVKTLPIFAYSSRSITIGPFKNRTSPPNTGHAFTVGGSRFLDLGKIRAAISFAATKVAMSRRPTFITLLSAKSIVTFTRFRKEKEC
nr:peptidyl-prolyl cis-trans isomerase FKBP19, chloroplastic [Ipomoea batatas]